MKRYGCVILVAFVALGATWSVDRDVARMTVAVYAPEQPGVAATVYVDGADIMLPVGGANSRIIDLDGKRVLVMVTATALP